MDLVFEIFVIVVLILCIAKFVMPAFVVGYALNQGMEISTEEYLQVAEILKKDPRLKPFVDKAMSDNMISKSEFTDIINEQTKIDLK